MTWLLKVLTIVYLNGIYHRLCYYKPVLIAQVVECSPESITTLSQWCYLVVRSEGPTLTTDVGPMLTCSLGIHWANMIRFILLIYLFIYTMFIEGFTFNLTTNLPCGPLSIVLSKLKINIIYTNLHKIIQCVNNIYIR